MADRRIKLYRLRPLVRRHYFAFINLIHLYANTTEIIFKSNKGFRVSVAQKKFQFSIDEDSTLVGFHKFFTNFQFHLQFVNLKKHITYVRNLIDGDCQVIKSRYH